MLGFHVTQGLYFRRNQDGSVTVSVEYDQGDTTSLVREITVDVDGFASVVAAMSARGIAPGNFHDAHEFLTRAPKEN